MTDAKVSQIPMQQMPVQMTDARICEIPMQQLDSQMLMTGARDRCTRASRTRADLGLTVCVAPRPEPVRHRCAMCESESVRGQIRAGPGPSVCVGPDAQRYAQARVSVCAVNSLCSALFVTGKVSSVLFGPLGPSAACEAIALHVFRFDFLLASNLAALPMSAYAGKGSWQAKSPFLLASNLTALLIPAAVVLKRTKKKKNQRKAKGKPIVGLGSGSKWNCLVSAG